MFKSRIIAIVLAFALSFGQVSALEIVTKSKYQDALNYLDLINVIEDKDTFNPEKLINKAEFVTLLLKHAGYDINEMNRKIFTTPYQDVPLNAWYSPYVYIAYENGLLPENEYFYPERNLTRYEALSFFFALEGISAPVYAKNTQGFTDLPEKSKVNAIVLRALDFDLMTPVSKDYFGVMQKVTKGEVALMLHAYALSNQSGKIIQLDEGNSAYDEIPNYSVLMDVWDKIHSSYLFDEKINDEKMVNAAIEAMVNTLDDPFSAFMPPEEGSSYADSLEGELEGIGAYLGVEDGKIMIISPIQGSPAQKSGLKANDQIIKIDGESVEDLSLLDVVNKIKGPKETQVSITVMRGDKEITFEITREKIELKSVDLEMEGDIAVISLNQFISRTSQEFDDAAQEILNKKAKGIVLDLRNNPGGFLGVAIDVLGHFVKKGETVVSVDYPKTIFEEKAQGNAELASLPLVVLVNEGSASASEIVAGALQDLGLAKIVGQTSYGKGTVQELTYYNDGSNLKLTVAKWLTPKGTWINEKGITPDIKIENKEDQETDYQMERALREITN